MADVIKRTVDLGIVTAYAEAVEAGYTGTEEEFAEGLRKSAEYADNAQQSASDAQGYADDASGYATQASGYVSDALGYANDASGYADNASGYANDASGYADTAQGYANDASASATEAQGYVEQAEQVLEDKADVDGYYEEMTVGQLDSHIAEENSEPYLYRPTIGDSNRKQMTLVGGSLVWNQLCSYRSNTETQNGVTKTWDSTTRKYTISGTATANTWFQLSATIPFISGHKYLLIGATDYSATGYYLYVADSGNKVDKGNGIVWTGAGTTVAVYFTVFSGATVNMTFRPTVVDLTMMFGSTIADYILSIDQEHAGDGGAWVKKYINFSNTKVDGSLEHVSASAHKTVGFNQWDEEWELGSIDGSGTPTVDNTCIRAKNYIKVIGGTTYYIRVPKACVYHLWDSEMNYLGYTYLGSAGTINIPQNAMYMRFRIVTDYGTTYKNDICISLDSDRNGEYEPYKEWNYPLDDDLVLRGIPKKDADNNLYFDGDIYESDGTVTRKYGIVDLGSLSWYYMSGTNPTIRSGGISTVVKKPSANTVIANVLCSTYITSAVASYMQKSIGIGADGHIWVTDSAYSDASTFTTAMSGVYLVYELATETTESADPFADMMICDSYGTEEFITDSVVPVGNISKYPTDQVKKLDGLPSNFSTLIAPTEKTNKASQNYAVGSYLIMNNVLYKVTSAIAVGGTITVGSNVSATTIMAEILALA